MASRTPVSIMMDKVKKYDAQMRKESANICAIDNGHADRLRPAINKMQSKPYYFAKQSKADSAINNNTANIMTYSYAINRALSEISAIMQ